MLLLGLTLLKRSALSGVVSGQSASKEIGIFLAFSSSFFSSSVNASSFFMSSLNSIIFTIIQPPFEVRCKSSGNQTSHFCDLSVFLNQISLSVNNKQNIVYLITGRLGISNDSTSADSGSGRSVSYGIIPIFILTVFFVKQFNAIIIEEHTRCASERDSVFLDINPIFLFIILEQHSTEGKHYIVQRSSLLQLLFYNRVADSATKMPVKLYDSRIHVCPSLQGCSRGHGIRRPGMNAGVKGKRNSGRLTRSFAPGICPAQQGRRKAAVTMPEDN